jgi:hypothetical protein
MKSNQRITRIQLNVKQNDEFFLYGLVSAEPDYKLSLAINKKFGINMKNNDPVTVNKEEDSELSYSRFSDLLNSPELVFNLISNRSGKNHLLKKLKNIDYLFLIHDSENEKKGEDILSLLRDIESVNAIFPIEINTLKDKNLQYITN